MAPPPPARDRVPVVGPSSRLSPADHQEEWPNPAPSKGSRRQPGLGPFLPFQPAQGPPAPEPFLVPSKWTPHLEDAILQGTTLRATSSSPPVSLQVHLQEDVQRWIETVPSPPPAAPKGDRPPGRPSPEVRNFSSDPGPPDPIPGPPQTPDQQ